MTTEKQPEHESGILLNFLCVSVETMLVADRPDLCHPSDSRTCYRLLEIVWGKQ